MRNQPERLSSNEDVDLFQLIGWLWAQKILIAAVTVIVALAALAYALLSTPIYQATVAVQPPSQDDIAQVNIGRGEGTGLGRLSVKDVYATYLGNLQSQALRRKFFRDVYLPSLGEAGRQGSQDALYAEFNRVLTVAAVSPLTPDRFYVAADLPDPKMAAQWVAQYAQMASDWAKRDLSKDLRADAVSTANNLERQIKGARETARNLREDQIIRLSEALNVAKTIGLDKPPLISNTLVTEVSAGMDGSLTYMRGAKALESEIDNLRKRQSDDPFVKDLRERQETMNFYRDLQLNTEAVQVYRQDGAIEVPDRPIKPKKSLIVMLGTVAGLLLGVCLALYRGARSARLRAA
ncbi:hypothetical protein CR511_06830 [Pseudomonas putida]|jgi:chain length determinant protein (polysaccharide antigen chain regulator)|uniref:LPS O-antigen chain length determinant protein WzzB n=1 Tax=Pseudomonas kermanshahensis TaxID=2745482 RepID=UPI000C126BBF|nr:Wzz/FepE/Etk N-terminal domain-containing protein [Pseudomonas kermanshahensis]ATP43796.1 hypothetical protein CR511_06830 [Pseudomonas putida]USS57303.1 Wzz/FepE/Etk N-terminal domain-containing protein [Pseudomonas kermanshahensis]